MNDFECAQFYEPLLHNILTIVLFNLDLIIPTFSPAQPKTQIGTDMVDALEIRLLTWTLESLVMWKASFLKQHDTRIRERSDH